MESEVKKLKQLIDASERILVTAHISPDPDAVSSVLILSSALQLNFPDKKILAVLEEQPADLDFIEGYQNLLFKPLVEAIEGFKPDLFVLLDGNNYERASRHDGQSVRELIKQRSIKTAVIDHHETAGKDSTDVFINNLSPSTVQDVYTTCFDDFGLRKPAGVAQMAMVGFYADTGGFVYVKKDHPELVFGVAQKLVQDGADVEKTKFQLESYNEDDMSVIGELARNTSHKAGYTYSLLSDDFIAGWTSKGKSHTGLQRAINAYLNNYIRSVGGRTWGFIVYKNTLDGDNAYSASFRSQAGNPDVSSIAGRLGGGGHKPAAGARFTASSVEDAIRKVQQAIEELVG